MKKAQNWFISVVALIAMSFTLASETEIFKKIIYPTIMEEVCYTETNSSFTPPSSPISVTEGKIMDSYQSCLNVEGTVCCYLVRSDGHGDFEIYDVKIGPMITL